MNNSPKNDTPDKALVERAAQAIRAVWQNYRLPVGPGLFEKMAEAAFTAASSHYGGLVEALERIADPRNAHFAGDAQVVAREALDALSQPQHGGLVDAPVEKFRAVPTRLEERLLEDIAAMMAEFVENWPTPKKVSTALALIAKTLRAALASNSPVISDATKRMEKTLGAKFTVDASKPRPVNSPVAGEDAPCGHCGGVGDIDDGDHPCFACGGTGKRPFAKPTPTDTADRREAIKKIIEDEVYAIPDDDRCKVSLEGAGDAATRISSLIAVPDGKGYPEYTNAIGEAGQTYINRVSLNGDKVLGGNFYYADLWDAMNKAARPTGEQG